MKTAHQLTTLPPQVDPRQRMKEVRQTVASFLNGNNPDNLNHLGELPTNMDDARRVIVALHDLVEKGRTKNRKATSHICELVQILNSMSQNESDAMDMMSARDREIYEMNRLNDMNQQEIAALRREVDHMRQQRDAVLTTMKLQNNMAMAHPEPMVIPRETFGESNRATPATIGQLLRTISEGRAR